MIDIPTMMFQFGVPTGIAFFLLVMFKNLFYELAKNVKENTKALRALSRRIEQCPHRKN